MLRNCIDYVQTNGKPVPVISIFNINFNFILILGLCTDGVYKVPGVKSKVQSLKTQYNRRQSVNLTDYDLAVVTSLLKQYLRYCARSHVCVFILLYFINVLNANS